MNNAAIEALDWNKDNGLLPVIIQDYLSQQVLMLGYMNKQALLQTYESGVVTFYSRSKKRLWTKGETSGNTLSLVSAQADCDNDALLILAKPQGPTCHFNTSSCFGNAGMLADLQATIKQRYLLRPENSYVAELFNAGIKRIAQKVGEEGVELALASVSDERDEIINEAADLIFHLLVLLQACEVGLREVLTLLGERSEVVKVLNCEIPCVCI